jgi:two-component system chemotaxis response regulator CheY
MSYSILIVDDSPTIRSVIKKSISMSGIDVGEVHEAGNGIEALAVLSQQWIDIVLADINMPQMNGIELVEHMVKDKMLETTPVVIVSSERSQARVAEFKKRGVSAYIKKPFKPEDIRDVVIEVLGEARR